MKILIMVLSWNHPPFDALMKAQQKTWDRIDVPEVVTVYYYGSEENGNPKLFWNFGPLSSLELEVPANDHYYEMHWKFKRALDHVWDWDFDMIFRTNSSSYVNKAELLRVAETLPKERCYAGWKLQGTDEQCVSGAGIFLSRDCAEILKNEIPEGKNVEEDVLIGRILKPHGINIINDQSRVDYNINPRIVQNAYHYRCKNQDRTKDIVLFKQIHKLLHA